MEFVTEWFVDVDCSKFEGTDDDAGKLQSKNFFFSFYVQLTRLCAYLFRKFVYFPEGPGLSADFVSLVVVITDGATFSIFYKHKQKNIRIK